MVGEEVAEGGFDAVALGQHAHEGVRIHGGLDLAVHLALRKHEAEDLAVKGGNRLEIVAVGCDREFPRPFHAHVHGPAELHLRAVLVDLVQGHGGAKGVACQGGQGVAALFQDLGGLRIGGGLLGRLFLAFARGRRKTGDNKHSDERENEKSA